MSKPSCVNISDLSNTRTALDRTKSKGGCIVIDRGRPIAIVLGNDNAQAIIGDKIWDTNRYGHPISKISSNIIQNKDWFVPTVNGISSANMVVFNEDFIRDNWQMFQLSLNPMIVANIADKFDLPVFPHIELEAGKYKAVKYTNNLSTPHFPTDYMRRSDINFQVLADEINQLDRPITLTKKNPSTQVFKLVPMATALPINLLPEFEKAGVHITTRTPRSFFSQSKNHINTHEAIILRHKKATEQDPNRIIVVNSEPTENIQDILSQSTLPIQRLTRKSKLDTSELEETKLTKLQIGAVIAGHIMESTGRSRTVGSWINSETHGLQHIAVTGNPRTIELIQKIPLSESVNILRAGDNSFLRYAFAQSSWFSNTENVDNFLPVKSKSRLQCQIKLTTALTQLFEGARSLTIVFDEQNNPACAITGSHEIACAMKTIERSI